MTQEVSLTDNKVENTEVQPEVTKNNPTIIFASPNDNDTNPE